MISANTATEGETATEGTDRALRRARFATLGCLGGAWLAGTAAPIIALFVAESPTVALLGGMGVAAFAVALAAALYVAATPWIRERTRRWTLATFAAACVVAIPLTAPLGGDGWESWAWAWIAGATAGFAPTLVRRRTATVACVVLVVVTVLVALIVGGTPVGYLLVMVSIGVPVAGMSLLPAQLWTLLIQARDGRAAQARLAVTEERLRFARDVHDLLGHRLTIIALKTELAARLAGTDAERSARESSDAQRLAATALAEVREVINGYRSVGFDDQLAAIAKVLDASGVRCSVNQAGAALPERLETPFALLLREASTNVLRHSRATWCSISIGGEDDEVTLTVRNDGAMNANGDEPRPDKYSGGLRGAADRLREYGGVLRTGEEDGVFTFTAAVPSAS